MRVKTRNRVKECAVFACSFCWFYFPVYEQPDECGIMTEYGIHVLSAWRFFTCQLTRVVYLMDGLNRFYTSSKVFLCVGCCCCCCYCCSLLWASNVEMKLAFISSHSFIYSSHRLLGFSTVISLDSQDGNKFPCYLHSNDFFFVWCNLCIISTNTSYVKLFNFENHFFCLLIQSALSPDLWCFLDSFIVTIYLLCTKYQHSLLFFKKKIFSSFHVFFPYTPTTPFSFPYICLHNILFLFSPAFVELFRHLHWIQHSVMNARYSQRIPLETWYNIFWEKSSSSAYFVSLFTQKKKNENKWYIDMHGMCDMSEVFEIH